jgi:hypothetical protein
MVRKNWADKALNYLDCIFLGRPDFNSLWMINAIGIGKGLPQNISGHESSIHGASSSALTRRIAAGRPSGDFGNLAIISFCRIHRALSPASS